jgi:nitrous oxide reductase accessory protein NosL
VDLAALQQPRLPDRPTDWKVLFGEGRQFAAYFDDRAKAEMFAARHGGIIVPLGPV